MLVHLLRSHPEICAHDEVFSPDKVRGLSGKYLQRSREDPGFIEWLLPKDPEIQLINGGRSQLDKLLRFLGVSTRELTTTTRRLGRDNLRSVIANYDELREYFCESRFAKFFEDSIKRE